MISPRQLSRLNDRLGQELGRNAEGLPFFSWHWSEEPRKFLALVPDKYEYAANPATGIIAARPVYEVKEVPLAPHLVQQWVLCKWIAPMEEGEWRNQFGETLPWPKHGYVFPLNVELEHGTDPDIDATQCAIDLFRKQDTKSEADLVAEAENAENYREKCHKKTLIDRLDSAATAFGNLPGDRGGQVELQVGRGASMASDDVFSESKQ